MSYVRSTLVGLGFAVVAVLVNVLLSGFLLGPHVPADVSWSPAALMARANTPGLWVIAGAFFVAGFVWDRRRQAH